MGRQGRVIEVLASGARDQTRNMFRDKLKRGELDDTVIEIEITDNSNPLGGMELPGQGGMGMMDLSGLMKAFGGRRVTRKVTVAKRGLLIAEADKLLDDEAVKAAALESVQQNGIVFIDEIDKVAARTEGRSADVSREGVQRDLLPLIEATVEIRAGEDGSYPVHRLGCVPCRNRRTCCPNCRAACRSGRVARADRRGFRAHPDRDGQRADRQYTPDGTGASRWFRRGRDRGAAQIAPR